MSSYQKDANARLTNQGSFSRGKGPKVKFQACEHERLGCSVAFQRMDNGVAHFDLSVDTHADVVGQLAIVTRFPQVQSFGDSLGAPYNGGAIFNMDPSPRDNLP